MKKTLLLSVVAICATTLFAQKKPFEGTMIMKQTTYFHQGKVPQFSDVQVIQMKGQKSVFRNSKGEVVIIDYSNTGTVSSTTTTKAASGKYIALRMTAPLDMSMAAPLKKLEESEAEATTAKFDFDWDTKQVKDERLQLQGDFNKEYYQQMGVIEYPLSSKMSFTMFMSGKPYVTTSTELFEFTPKPISDACFNLPEGTIICNSVDEFTKCLLKEGVATGNENTGKSSSKKANNALSQSAPAAANANTGEKFIESMTTNPVVPESLWDF